MGWNISTYDNKYQIKYGSNTSYNIIDDDISYLTITDTKHIGLNNENPSSDYLLDINGITHINSNLYITGNVYISCNEYINKDLYITSNVEIGKTLYTSNIIGVGSSNNIVINYTSPTNYSNNLVQIYGNTSFIGRVNINNITSNTFHLLEINGSMRASRIYGEGCNIFNLNASYVSLGILEPEHGGTGLSNIGRHAILFGGANNRYLQNTTFKYDGTTLFAEKFRGNLNADDITDGIVTVIRGGTGLSEITKGCIPVGNGKELTQLSSDLKFDINTKTLALNTLQLANSNIYVLDPNNTIRKFNYNDVGLYDATSNSKGIVMPSEEDFDTSNGILKLKSNENLLWKINTTGSNIYFPNDIKFDAGIICFAGINNRDPLYALDVAGDINSSSNYRINGSNLFDLVIDYASSNLKLDSLSGINVATMKFVESQYNDFVGGTKRWSVNTFDATTIEVNNFVSKSKTLLNTLAITDTSTSSASDNLINVLSITSISRVLDDNEKLLKFTKAGNLLIGPNLQDQVPSQRLEIIGNIHASGHIRSYYSDDRLKTLTSNITGALDIIDSLKGFHYVPNKKALELGFEYDNEIGLSAQDVKKVVPEIVKIAPFDTIKDMENGQIVSKSGEDYLTICYERLGAVFVEAIKELRKENMALKSELKTLKKDLDNIKNIIYIQ